MGLSLCEPLRLQNVHPGFSQFKVMLGTCIQVLICKVEAADVFQSKFPIKTPPAITDSVFFWLVREAAQHDAKWELQDSKFGGQQIPDSTARSCLG